MRFVKNITLSFSALLLSAGVAVASETPKLEQSATQANTSNSQIKEQPKLGNCWYYNIYIC